VRALAVGELAAQPEDRCRLLPLFTDDVLDEDVTVGADNRGKAALQAFATGVFPAFPDLAFALTPRAVAGERAGLGWTTHGTRATPPGQPTAHQPFSVRGVTILELWAGKVRRNADYRDVATQLKQLGPMPAG
jgi:steroid delta-isomerase-like uncharacterized protein